MKPSMLNLIYARLYGLTRDELRYTLCVDPKEVHGEDSPGETFRVLKEKEVRLYGDAPQSDVTAGAGSVGWAGSRMTW
jgi:hypothetical protein